MQTQVEIAKDAKAQANHAQTKIKANAHRIRGSEKAKRCIGRQMEVMHATLEQAKRKVFALNAQIVG